ncbi:MAG: OmpA family protein [Muribaculaceae bacterium]|nr:OmpA family protein [Muribaculaceae bacterium]
MKLKNLACISLLCGALLFGETSCGITNTGKGALIGGGGGAALGAGIGALIGGGKGAAIGAAIGAGAGAGTGALIGNKMDKQQKELEEQLANQAKVEETTDMNGYRAIKVTFEGGILFPTNGTTLSAGAKTDLAKFAESLKANPGTNVEVYGFTDNTGSMKANEKVATGRADAVLSYLVNQGISPTRIAAQGVPMANYIASNDTAAGRAQNRRVEIYIMASPEMIKQAEEGTLK